MAYGTGTPEPEKDDEMPELPEGTDASDGDVIRFILSCRNEAKLAKWNRVQQTRENYDVYWGRHDFAHKLPGQSREVLAMQPMAIEQTSSFFQQALVDMGADWWRAGARNPRNEDQQKVKPDVIQALTQLQLDKAQLLKHVGLGTKAGLLGGNIISKIHGCWVDSPVYVAERRKLFRKATLRKASRKVWQLKLDLVSQFNYYPDPTPGHYKLYEIEDMWLDYYELLGLSQGDDAIYDPEVVEKVEHKMDDDAEEKFDEMRRNNQNQAHHGFRGRVKVTEFWGTILDINGRILKENCVATLANDRWLIRKPTDNPLWHQKSPYVVSGLLESPDTVWPKALADAGTKYNIAANELFNLMLDGAMRSVHGIGQIHTDWLEDPAQVEGGIKPGTNLNVNSQCAPGARVMESLIQSQVPPDALQIQNMLNQEFNRAMLTSDIRQGMQPRADVPATQIVEASHTITSVFQGMSKMVESNWMQPLLEKCWQTVAQFSDDLDEDEVRAVLSKDDADSFLKLTPEERFAATVQGTQFSVFGISLSLQKQQDFRKVATLLQTIGGAAPLMEAFVKRFSFDELLNFAMRSLGIPVKQLEIPQHEQDMMKAKQGAQDPAAAQQGPQDMSQVQSPNTGSLADQMGSQAPTSSIAQTKFSGTGQYARGGTQ